MKREYAKQTNSLMLFLFPMNNDKILYREFWIRCTKDKLIDLSEDLVTDARVQDFDKMESDICKSDAESVIRWIEWATPLLRPMFSPDNTTEQNRIRLMQVLKAKLERRVKA